MSKLILTSDIGDIVKKVNLGPRNSSDIVKITLASTPNRSRHKDTETYDITAHYSILLHGHDKVKGNVEYKQQFSIYDPEDPIPIDRIHDELMEKLKAKGMLKIGFERTQPNCGPVERFYIIHKNCPIIKDYETARIILGKEFNIQTAYKTFETLYAEGLYTQAAHFLKESVCKFGIKKGNEGEGLLLKGIEMLRTAIDGLYRTTDVLEEMFNNGPYQPKSDVRKPIQIPLF
ncbi:MAG: hypothetical protein ABIC04_05805 [Nanoarchaeota archaeon]